MDVAYAGVCEAPPMSCSLNQKFATSTLNEGKEYYTDRTYTLAIIPSQYWGMDMIKSPNDEKNNTTASDYLTFTLAQDTTVYVAYSSRRSVYPTG